MTSTIELADFAQVKIGPVHLPPKDVGGGVRELADLLRTTALDAAVSASLTGSIEFGHLHDLVEFITIAVQAEEHTLQPQYAKSAYPAQDIDRLCRALTDIAPGRIYFGPEGYDPKGQLGFWS